MRYSNTEFYGIRLGVNDYAPRFKQDDILILDPLVGTEAGDDVFINRKDGGFSIGTFAIIEDGRLHLRSAVDDSTKDWIATSLIKSISCIIGHGHRRGFATGVSI